MRQAGSLPVAVDADFENFLTGRRKLLDERLAAIDVRAKSGVPNVIDKAC